MEEPDLASESMIDNEDYESELDDEQAPKLELKVNYEAKLNELLHRIHSPEIKLCSAATKEFIKLLKSDSGGELLRHYVTRSSRCSELIEAWKLRQEKPGISYLVKLISVVLNHPDGRYRPNDKNGIVISRALDKFARSIIEEHLQDLYKEINSRDFKSQSAALLLLASIVRRGSVLASDLAKIFDFKLKGFANLSAYKKRRDEKTKLKKRETRSSRKAFVGFAMSFLEIGKPGLLRWVLQQKEMYSGVLRGLGNNDEDGDGDDDETVVYVLTILREKILVEESLVPPGLRSVLFGSVTLERLMEISGRENGGYVSELAHSVLVLVCIDPSNGLMPDPTRLPSPLKGNLRRLLGVMKKLKATEVVYHRDLLLAIVCGRPYFGAGYMEQFPYNLEDFALPNWFAIVNLAANLVSSVAKGLNFDIIGSQLCDPLSPDSTYMESLMKCLFPRSFSQSVITKGLLHSDFLVKHGTLRLLSEGLKLLDSLIGALNIQSSSAAYVSLKQEVQNEVRSSLPDPQVLVTLLSSLNSQSKTRDVSLKRKTNSGNFSERGRDSKKKLKKDTVDDNDSDIVIGGISIPASNEDSERVEGETKADDFDSGKDIENTLEEIWGSDLCGSSHFVAKEADSYFQSKLLDALKTYFKVMPAELEKLFMFLTKLLNDPLSLPTNLQHSLLSYLMEYVGWSPTGMPINVPPLMYKHLQSFINLLIFSPIGDVKSQAYDLARAAMLSTGAFDRNHHEIGSWFLFLPGYDRRTSSSHVPGLESLQGSCQVVISFLCDAISTMGNSLFKYWDIVKVHTCNLKGLKDVSPDFSPLVVCILQKCLRLLDSKSDSFGKSEKSMISLYVGDTLKYILQTQADAKSMSSVIDLILFERLGESNSAASEWRPLKNLSLFSRSILRHQHACLFSIDKKSSLFSSSFETNKTASTPNTLGFFSKETPFHVIFASIMSNGGLYSSETKKIKDLSAKLQEWKFDNCYLSYLRLLLFWIHQIQSSYRVSSAAKLPELSEICFILLKDLMGQILDSKARVDCPRTQEIQEVVETIFCHPVVVTSISCPLSCDVGLAKESLQHNLNTLIDSRQSIHNFDHLVLDILVTATEFLFSHCDEDSFKASAVNGGGQKLVKVFNVLIQRVFEEMKCKFKDGISSGDLMIIVPPYCALQAMIHFVSPFELLKLVKWMLEEVKIVQLAVQESSKRSGFSFVTGIVSGAFRNLSSYLVQPFLKRRKYDMFWEMKDSEDFNLVEEIYLQMTEFSLYLKIDYVDTCLLDAIDAVHKQKHAQYHNFHRLNLVMSRIVPKTTVKTISHCIHRTTKTKSKFLFLLTDMSSLHLSSFGELLFGIVNKDLLHGDEMVEENSDNTLSDEDYMMLLPVALSYLNSTLTKHGAKYYKHFKSIPAFYSVILLKGFGQWKSFTCSEMFEEEYGNVLPSSSQELLCLVNDSLLGKAIHMLQHHLASDGDSMKLKKRLKLFNSIFPLSPARDELIDCEFGEAESCSVNQSLNRINRVVAKISLCRMLLFPIRFQINFLSKESSVPKDTDLEMGSTREVCSRMYFLKVLAEIWQLIVEKFPSVSDISETSADVFSLYRYLEDFVLRSILELATEMQGSLVQQETIPFLEQLTKSALRHRYEDPTTLKMLQEILTVLSEGKFSRDLYLQLLLAHSHFESTIRSVSNLTNHSHVGAFSRPMPGILRYLGFNSTENVSNRDSDVYSKQLGILKLLQTLCSFKSDQLALDFGKSVGIKFRQLHLLLLSSYGATLGEMDLEIHNLLSAIESIDGVEAENIAGFDHLWGNAASKIEKEQALERETASIVNDPEAVKERRRSQFRENLPIDPKICVSTVLYYPYDITTSSMPVVRSSVVGYPERYDPVFILRFSLYCLSVGYIEPIEFTALGLLAIAFVSISSPDDGIRRLAYSTLEKFKNALEQCKQRKEVKQIRLLLTSLQNGIEEPWQRIPSVVAVFAAEASFILLDASHDHHATLSRHFTNSAKMNMKNVPMFNDFFWSVSVNFKAERLWILRLLYVGLNSDDDAQIYTRNSILETLMSFYFSPLSDNETNYLILQVVKKSTKSYKLTRHLVENCGFFPWSSSVLLISDKMSSKEEKEKFIKQSAVVLKVVNDVISFRNVNEWLQKEALEQLTELTSHLFRFLVDGIVSANEHAKLVDLILEIMASTLKLSHKRTKIFQPHFNISIDGLHRICKVISEDDNAVTCTSSELGLKVVLMSIPPPSIVCMGREKLQHFLTWAISSALQAESSRFLQNKASQSSLSVVSEEEQHKESLVSKLLRWLAASVILGKLATTRSNDDLGLKTCSSLKDFLNSSEQLESACEESTIERVCCEEFLASSILFLQQQVTTNHDSLPSVVSALSILLHNTFRRADGFDSHELESLWSKTRFPAEANPAWRWRFYQPWKHLSSELSDSQKIDELHSCQALVFLMSNVIGGIMKDVSKIRAFKWEKRILIDECSDK